MRKKMLILAALSAILAGSAPAQTADDWAAVKAKWKNIDQKVNIKAAQFFLDPRLLREVATPEIEQRFRDRHGDVLEKQDRLDSERSQLPQKGDARANAEAAFQLAADELAAKKLDLLNVQSGSAQFPIDERDAALEKANATVAEAHSAWAVKRDAQDAARKAVDKASDRIGIATIELNNARKAETAVIAERKEWLNAHPETRGAVLERDTVVIRFKRDTPIADIEQILNSNGLDVKSGILRIALFITFPIEKTIGDDSVAALRVRNIIQSIRTKKGRDWVLDAYPSIAVSGTSTPARSTQGDPSIDSVERWNWYDTSLGTLASRVMKFPQAWNLKDAINPLNAPRVVVIDEAFSDHHDLPATQICETVVNESGHGNRVAGVIGARFGKTSGPSIGVDGGAPFVELLTCAPGLALQSQDEHLPIELKQRAALFTAVAQHFEAMASDPHPPRVVNISLGYNWNRGSLRMADAPENDDIRSFVAGAGSSMRALLKQFPEVLVVSAAGNDSDPKAISSAQWSNPFNWAAVGGDSPDGLPRSDNVLVVQSNQSVDPTVRVLTSGGDGNIAAPGVDVVSTSDDQKCARDSGTSMAAPQITALVALMLSYNPDLKVQDIMRILDAGQPTVPNAFIALARSKPDQFARDIADITGDGKVDIDDFNKFSDQLADFVNGQRTGTFKLDLNGDGDVDGNEAMFPRCDFNGDGRISIHDPSPVAVGAAGTLTMLTDLEVMLLAWKDPPFSRVELEQRLEAAVKAATTPK